MASDLLPAPAVTKKCRWPIRLPENLNLAERFHVDGDDVGEVAMAAVPASDDGQAKTVLDSPSNTVLDILDACWLDGCGRMTQAGL